MIDLRQNKGFALVFSLIFLFLIVSFMAVYILAVASGISQASYVANEKKSYYTAEAGLADAYELITQAGANTVLSNNSFIPSPNTDNGYYSFGTTHGNYAVSVIYSNAPRSNYTLVYKGTYGNVSKTLQLKIMGASISKYAYWSDEEVNPSLGVLWWVGMPGLEMLTTGPVQTNGQLNIFGNPIFNSAVTESNLPMIGNTLGSVPTSNSPNYYYGTANNPNGNGSDPAYIFKQGITNDAPPIKIPPQQTLTGIQSVANDGAGLVLTGASTVIFNPTGTISVTGTVKNANCVTTATYNNTTIAAPANGVIYVQSTNMIPKCNSNAQDGNVTVQGTVKGQLTVAADQNIDLSGSVAYNTDPRVNPNSTDMLGLVANQNITVIEATAPAQLELSAVLVALNGSFQADNWWTYKGNATTAVMDQFGSLINFVCGATGEMDLSGNLLGGWNQIQSYDTRLGTQAPPGFPTYVNNAGDGVYNKISITECVSGVCG